MSISTTTPAFLGSALQANIDGLTLVRTRGYFSLRLTLAVSDLDGFAGAVGIGIATLAAVTAGISSVPTPITEQDSEHWIFWQAFEVKAQQLFVAGGSPGLEQHGVYDKFMVDSKAMRKFNEDDALYACVEMVEVGAATVQIHHDSRMLFKLP